MMTREEELREKIEAEVRDEKSLKWFDLKIKDIKYGTARVEAHNLEEAKDMALFLDDDEIDWNDFDMEVEEDV